MAASVPRGITRAAPRGSRRGGRARAALALGAGLALASCSPAEAGDTAVVTVLIVKPTVQVETAAGPVVLEGVQHELPRSETLILGEDAFILIDNYASFGDPIEKRGPGTVRLSSLPAPPPGARRKARENRGFFERRSDSQSLGGSRGGGGPAAGLRLLRPVSGPILRLEGREIRWDCAECGPLALRVFEDPDAPEQAHWTGSGKGRTPYDGPPLVRDFTFYLALEGLDKPIQLDVLSDKEARRVEQALAFCAKRERRIRKAGVTDPASLAACSVEVYRAAGLYSEALSAVDKLAAQQAEDPRVLGLLELLEREAGIRE